MEGPDRPVFPEILPLGPGLPVTFYPQALKPFPEEPNPEDLPIDGEQEPLNNFVPGD